MSKATIDGAEIFTKSIIDKEIMGITLKEGDMIFGIGSIDESGEQIIGDIPSFVYNRVLQHFKNK